MDKTKIMVVGREQDALSIVVNEMSMEQVNDYGIHIQSTGKQVAEINDRISAATKVFYTLNKSFLGKKEISRYTLN